eukprot:SAG11_NODE_3693_length_2276_cov_2.074414_3_plen_97_part_00
MDPARQGHAAEHRWLLAACFLGLASGTSVSVQNVTNVTLRYLSGGIDAVSHTSYSVYPLDVRLDAIMTAHNDLLSAGAERFDTGNAEGPFSWRPEA